MATQAVISGQGDQRRTLVVIFLRGAADGLALVPPLGDDHFHRARPRLAAVATKGVRLDDLFGLHARMRSLENAWREGELAIVHACGIEDDTRSHFEAQDLMEHGGVAAGAPGHRPGQGRSRASRWARRCRNASSGRRAFR
jgi:uncharacterized protein (DUF1501 family)